MGRGMGAVSFPYPKWVWTPTGGYWCNPPNWKRNTAICAGVWAVCLFFTFKFSIKNERRFCPPVDAAYPIPSQYWCEHAVEDDPRRASAATRTAPSPCFFFSPPRRLFAPP